MSVSRSAAASREVLAGERDYLLASLADLERERAAGDVDDLDYATLRAGYVTRAAELLRRLDELDREEATGPAVSGPAAVPGAPPAGASGACEAGACETGAAASGVAARSPFGRLRLRLGTRRARRALAAGGLACLAGLATVLALALAGVRLPGQPASGSVSLPRSEVIAQDLDEASVLGTAGEIVQAIHVYGQVLALDPEQPEALAYGGWLQRLTGVARHDAALVRSGDASIARAIRADAAYPDAHAFDAIALLQDDHDRKAGIAQLRAFLGDRPPKSLLRALGPSIAVTFRNAGVAIPASLRPYEGSAASPRAGGAGPSAARSSAARSSAARSSAARSSAARSSAARSSAARSSAARSSAAAGRVGAAAAGGE